MSDAGFEELAQRELDGETSAEESARLRRRLETSATARARFAELQQLFATLGAVPDVEPPPLLETRIVQAVRAAAAAAPRRRTEPFWSAWVRPLRERAGLGHAYAFATGALAGVALLAVLGRLPDLGRDSAAGTMAPPASGLERSRPIDEQHVEVDGLRATLRTRAAGGLLLVEIDTDARRPGTISLGFAAAAFDPVRFERGDATGSGLEIAAGRVRFAAAGRRHDRFVVRDPGGEDLVARIECGGEAIERRVRTARP